MLVMKVTMVEGRTPEQKAQLMERLTRAARHLGWPEEQVRLIIYEVPKAHWAIGGVPMADPRKGVAG